MDSDTALDYFPPRLLRQMDVVVVVAIATLVIGLAVAVISRVRAAASHTNCQNNLRNITLGCLQAEMQHMQFPPAFGTFAKKNGSLFYHLLPFIEEAGAYACKPASFDLHVGEGTRNVGRTRIPMFNCSADGSADTPGVDLWWGTSSYAANWLVCHPGTIYLKDGQQAVVPGVTRIPLSFKDGTANTIMFAEKYAVCGATGGSRWAYPPAISFNATSPPDNFGSFFAFRAFSAANPFGWSLEQYQEAPDRHQCQSRLAQSSHPGGIINVAMADGMVKSVSGLTIAENTTSDDPFLAMQATAATQLGSTSFRWRTALTPSGIALRNGVIGPGPSD